MADLNRLCSKELKVNCGGRAIACQSACEAFGQDKYCCSGTYGTPTACHLTVYSSIFKSLCPRAYSYTYDDSTSTFTCKAYDYRSIAFCLPTSGIKRSDATFFGAQVDDPSTSHQPLTDNNGGGGAHEPSTTASSANTQYIQLWFLPLLIFFF